MRPSPARRLLGAVCGLIAVASITMVVPAAVAEPGWGTDPAVVRADAPDVAAPRP